MSLRKSPTLTLGLLEACRRNAQKSTGPRTVRGKANVRMNALREGGRSQVWEDFAWAVFNAPPGGVERTVRALLTPDLARHPKFTYHAEIAIEADLPEPERLRKIRALVRGKKKGIPYFFAIKAGILLKIQGLKKQSWRKPEILLKTTNLNNLSRDVYENTRDSLYFGCKIFIGPRFCRKQRWLNVRGRFEP